MASNFVETVKNYFTSEFTNQASNALNESESGISKALSALIPTGLAGILNRATASGEGANNILDMARSAAGYLSPTPNVANLNRENETSGLLSSLFGSNQSGIFNAISNFAGIKHTSLSSLSALVLPAIMGLLGRHANENNLSASGLSGFLSSQKNHIMNALPSGLSSVAGMLGLGGLGAAATHAATETRAQVNRITDPTHLVEDEKPAGGAKWLLPLLLILAAIALIWYFSKGCNKTDTTSTITDSSTTVITPVVPDTNTSTVTTVTHESMKVKLPNGKEIDAWKGGIEDQLVTFLSGDWKSMSDDDLKNKWFNFDNLNFNTGNAVLLPESEKQLDNIAEILKAFPDAKLKIGGYTDASGDAAFNLKLSKDRAEAAKNGLNKRGVGKQVLEAEGYGSQFATVAATAPDAEREIDRHVSVSVRK